ncbi:MAG: hypothetical protein ACHP7C_01860, partial [Lysobacterales bacterium]
MAPLEFSVVDVLFTGPLRARSPEVTVSAPVFTVPSVSAPAFVICVVPPVKLTAPPNPLAPVSVIA